MGDLILGMAAGSQMDNSYLMEKKFELMIDSNNKKLVNEINALKGAVSSLNIEIASLRKQVNDMQTSPVAPAAAPVFERDNNNVAVNQDAQPAQARNSAATGPVRGSWSAETARGRGESIKPRFGDYTPEDVPVEKFFYFGNKKR